MAKKKLIKGNVALAEGAIIAGCRYYFGYPITPQNEIPEYMASRMPEVEGTFIQAESEVASINMVLGAAAAGAIAMTSTSSPGYSLMQEGVSYLAAAQLPCLLVNVQRGGPGLGNIGPAQSDYFQAVKGGGHGDYKIITLAPDSPQEMMDFAILGIELAEKYRNPALILSDGIIGQMMESVEIRNDYQPKTTEKPWALTGSVDREPNIVRSLWLDEFGVEKNNFTLQDKYKEIEKNEIRAEEYQTEDAQLILVAYGLPSRICRSVVDQARNEGLKVGLLRPITLYPFPTPNIKKLTSNADKGFLVVEMSVGQMVEDVKLAVNGEQNIDLYSTFAGRAHDEKELLKRIKAYFQ